jgi:uncharacterized repeat protein (TIGR03803 family)
MPCIYRPLSMSALAVLLLSPPNAAASESVTLYSFPYDSGYFPNGETPTGPLAIGKNGALYGTTEYGGAYLASGGSGTVFSLTAPESPGGAWTQSVLWSFGGTSTDGEVPLGGVVIGPEGSLYGTTVSGGASGGGTAYSLAPPASPGGTWTETILDS